ncbi:hypothetical protein GGX14DRAFT_455161 [Mycena pura]|uniref:Uncharacterized protein n=1 Tax=Mycena pura TaxID=153505 RepID=A0AAD6VBN8_9AGAR|nr:hypothetical protein GGX14DRAFT_455161 [Mycena pura]
MSSKSASRKRSGPGAVSCNSSLHGGPSSSLHPRIHRPAMNAPIATLFMFLVLSCVITPCRAQTSKIFQWQFTQQLSTSLPSCQQLPIIVKPFSSTNITYGAPPYYMISVPVNNVGTPSTTLIGTDPNSLSWTVNQPVGAQLLLYVVDSQGSSGGPQPQLHNVTTGQSIQCILPPSTEQPFNVTANVTTTLTTCQPWGLTVAGGTPPYQVTLVELASPIVTNASLGPGDDVTGRWASGSIIVSTAGSTDVDCTGLVSSSSTTAQIKAEAQEALAATKSRHSAAVVGGVVVTLVVLLLLAGAGVFLYLRRRKVIRAARQVAPDQFEGGVIDGAPGEREVSETGTRILSINAFIEPASPQRSAGASARSPSHASGTTLPRRYDSASASPSVESNTPGGGLSVRNPAVATHRGFTNFPTASVRRSAKEIEAGLSSEISEDSEYSDASHASSSPLVGRSQSAGAATSGGARAVPLPMRSASASVGSSRQQEIIFQHQDAGMLRELPPPYIDRGTQQGP